MPSPHHHDLSQMRSAMVNFEKGFLIISFFAPTSRTAGEGLPFPQVLDLFVSLCEDTAQADAQYARLRYNLLPQGMRYRFTS